MSKRTEPVVTAQLLIRKPVTEVFTAFVDPSVTTRFWFTKSSGPVETGAELTWQWEMYGASAPVQVKEVKKDELILLEWGQPSSFVEWTFSSRPEGTLVAISNWGRSGSPEEVQAWAIDAKGGFTSLLAGAKAFLEHNIELNLVGDHHPDAHVSPVAG